MLAGAVRLLMAYFDDEQAIALLRQGPRREPWIPRCRTHNTKLGGSGKAWFLRVALRSPAEAETSL